MKIAVWDTYVERSDRAIMHFDILVHDSMTDENKIFGFGNQYLETKSFGTGTLSSKECRFCHMERAPEAIVEQIEEKGFFIIEMENCN